MSHVILNPFLAVPTITELDVGARNAEAKEKGDFSRPGPSLSRHHGCEYGPNVTKLAGGGW